MAEGTQTNKSSIVKDIISISSNHYPLVSIGIPTFNRAAGYLRHALESALNQTYQNIEIIVSDNCSTDNTDLVVGQYQDPRIRFFQHKINIGANNNFNYCLNEARGDYFLLLQDDDLIDRDFIDVCMKEANYNTEIGLIRSGVRVIDSDGNVLSESLNNSHGLSTANYFLNWFARKSPMLLCSILFNTKKIKEIGGFNSKYQLWQDVCAEFRVAIKFGRIDIPDVKASFRKHSSQMTFNVDILKWCEDSLYLLNLMCNLAENDKDLIEKEGMDYFCMHNYEICSKISSPFRRYKAYMTVFRKFNYKHIPPSFYRSIYKTPLYYPIRFIKRKLNQIAASR